VPIDDFGETLCQQEFRDISVRMNAIRQGGHQVDSSECEGHPGLRGSDHDVTSNRLGSRETTACSLTASNWGSSKRDRCREELDFDSSLQESTLGEEFSLFTPILATSVRFSVPTAERLGRLDSSKGLWVWSIRQLDLTVYLLESQTDKVDELMRAVFQQQSDSNAAAVPDLLDDGCMTSM